MHLQFWTWPVDCNAATLYSTQENGAENETVQVILKCMFAESAAGFPAGTVSGAPKVRAMQIIDELERDKRGPYGGCIGYFGANGEMDTCIVLRTAIVKGGTMHVQAGAGIVYDSNPMSEQQECINKSKALFRAAEEAVRFASFAKRGQ
jgi:anthranilate synthase component 1